jgi:hypothetical protein
VFFYFSTFVFNTLFFQLHHVFKPIRSAKVELLIFGKANGSCCIVGNQDEEYRRLCYDGMSRLKGYGVNF